MKNIGAIIAAMMLASCAAQHQVALYPRGAGNQKGAGSLDRMTNDLRVTVGDRNYRGPMIMKTSSSSGNLFSTPRTTYSNEATALLLGDSGQMRCEFGFDAMWTQATGVCVDNMNVTYDMLIK